MRVRKGGGGSIQMYRTPRITVVGSNMIDLITNIERMPKKGETVEAPHFDMGFGGKGANQAVAAALLGAEVAMVTKVGDDMFGKEVIRNFESFGIDTSFVNIQKETSNGVAPIFVDPDGSNSIFIVKGANSHVGREDVEKARAVIAHSDLVLLQLEIPLDTVYCGIELCEKLGVPVLLNPAPGCTLDFTFIKKVLFFVPNETELEIITGMPVSTAAEISAAAAWLLEKEVRKVIVTLGEKGSLLVSERVEELVPAVKVQPKDTTGAGDAFIGSFAYYYLVTGDTKTAMERANLYAAFSTLRTGTQKSFSRRDEFEKAVKGRFELNQ
jgi:ribokinase